MNVGIIRYRVGRTEQRARLRALRFVSTFILGLSTAACGATPSSNQSHRAAVSSGVSGGTQSPQPGPSAMLSSNSLGPIRDAVLVSPDGGIASTDGSTMPVTTRADAKAWLIAHLGPPDDEFTSDQFCFGFANNTRWWFGNFEVLWVEFQSGSGRALFALPGPLVGEDGGPTGTHPETTPRVELAKGLTLGSSLADLLAAYPKIQYNPGELAPADPYPAHVPDPTGDGYGLGITLDRDKQISGIATGIGCD